VRGGKGSEEWVGSGGIDIIKPETKINLPVVWGGFLRAGRLREGTGLGSKKTQSERNQSRKKRPEPMGHTIKSTPPVKKVWGGETYRKKKTGRGLGPKDSPGTGKHKGLHRGVEGGITSQKPCPEPQGGSQERADLGPRRKGVSKKGEKQKTADNHGRAHQVPEGVPEITAETNTKKRPKREGVIGLSDGGHTARKL